MQSWIAEHLTPLIAGAFVSAPTDGNVHYSRFGLRWLSEKDPCVSCYFRPREFGQLMTALAGQAGSRFFEAI